MTNNSKIITFDIETQNTFEELKMFRRQDKDPSKLRIAIAGILYNDSNRHLFFGENQTDFLIKTLIDADLIIGHNLLQFDYKLLQSYTSKNIIDLLYSKTFDTMIKLLPFTDDCWTSLDNLAQLNLGMCKPISGIKIPEMWRNNQLKEVEEYLLNDLIMTKEIYEHIKKSGKVKYTHKEYGTIIGDREVTVNW